MSQPRPLISIVSTVYKSRAYLDEFISSCLSSLNAISCTDYEMIFVNDGSPDQSLQFLLEKKRKIPQITVLDLARNFGHHYAAFAGLQYSKGEYVFLSDCDLEVSPQVLEQFYQMITRENADVVYGYQERRKGQFLEKILGGFFWKTINWLSDINIPANIVTERLMTRKYVDNLIGLGDKNLFLGGMMYWVGFNQIGTPVKKKLRKERSSYSIVHRIKLMFEAITSFSTIPLRIMFYFGLILSSVSFLSGAYLVVQKLLHPNQFLSGYVSIVIIVIFFSGIIEMSFGLLGLYIGKIFKQVQNRPLFTIKNIY